MQSDSYSIADIEAFASRHYNGRQVLVTPWAYTLSFSNFSAGTTQSKTITMLANADFIALQFHHRATLDDATQTVTTKVAPLVRMLVVDSGSQEQFTAAAVDLECYSTNGNITNQLPYPRILEGKTTITIQVTSYAASQGYNLDIVMDGALLRAYSGS
jgi:hypothetical protein